MKEILDLLKKVYQLLLTLVGKKDGNIEEEKTIILISNEIDVDNKKIRIITQEPTTAFLKINDGEFKLHSNKPYQRKDKTWSHAKKIDLEVDFEYQWKLTHENKKTLVTSKKKVDMNLFDIIDNSGKGNGNTGNSDTENPVAGTISVSNLSYNYVELSANPTDNVSVIEIKLYKDNGTLINTFNASSFNNYPISGLVPETNYGYYIVVKDAAGNTNQSPTLNITTPTTGGGGNLYPILYNFRNDNTNKDRIYFDCLNLLTASNVTGFKLGDDTGVTVASVAINAGQTTDHYFTLSRDLSYWDNNAIRYEGGSDIKDTGNLPILPFTLDFISQNIAEPTTTVDRYVSVNGTGNGSTEATSASLTYAFANATGGETWWIKAGNYGHLNLTLNNQGTATYPIKFKGYKTVVEDITTNYLKNTDGNVSYNNIKNNWNTSEMPTLTGNDLTDATPKSSSDIAIVLEDVSYVFFENIQIEKYAQGIQNEQSNSKTQSHLVFKNVNGRYFREFNFDHTTPLGWTGGVKNPECYSHFINLESRQGEGFVNSDYCKFIDLVALNSNLGNVFVLGDGNNLFKGLHLFNDESRNMKDSTDYILAFNGNNNIATGIYSRDYAFGAPTLPIVGETNKTNQISNHGIGVRSTYNYAKIGTNESQYNLIDNSIVYNSTEAFYIRNYDASNNIIKNCQAFQDIADPEHISGAYFFMGGDNNIIENVTADGFSYPIGYNDNLEDNVTDGNGDDILSEVEQLRLGHNNILKNGTFTNFYTAVDVNGYQILGDRSDYNASNLDKQGTFNNNKIIKCSFDGGNKYLVNASYAQINVFDFEECNFRNITTPYAEMPVLPSTITEPLDKFVFTNCNFWEVKGGSGGAVDYVPTGNADGGNNTFIDE